jgi:hypothetical protein
MYFFPYVEATKLIASVAPFVKIKNFLLRKLESQINGH